MNRFLNIIPTPQYCQYTPGDKLSVTKICVIGEKAPVLQHALDTLQGITDCAQPEAQVIVYADFAQVPSPLLDMDDTDIFEERFANEQGYILKTAPNGQIVLIAKSQVGCAYGILTLRQIIGLPVGTFTIRDWPDFRMRGIKWLIWAETGACSFDFGDGVDAMAARMQRNLDQLFLYKINYVFADGFGFDADRFEGYADMMRAVCDYARARGIRIATGGYGMSYGMAAFLNSYQGKDFYNRKSYPDGEIYECLGSYVPDTDPVQWRTLNRGTCLSNEALFDLKMEEIENFVRKTHIGALSIHNMDAHDLAPGLWLTRCEECRKRWPNDDLYAKDGMAGAFAEFTDKIFQRLNTIKDGDYDASRDLMIRMTAPGYMYYAITTDEDFDVGINFWKAVTEFTEEKDRLMVGFREQFFYHNKPVLRADYVKKADFKATPAVGNFNGCDGFYDDKLFSVTAALQYTMKGYGAVVMFSGNAFQEPLQIFNGEYMWNSEHSGFYNIDPRPTDFASCVALFKDMLASKVRPDAVYGEGGFLDVVCRKLYGEEAGAKMAKVYKLSGPHGEPPIPFAANVDIFTNYNKVNLPFAWAIPMTEDEIAIKTERFYACKTVTQQAEEILNDVLASCEMEQAQREKFTVYRDCFHMGAALCDLLHRYMLLYNKLHQAFAGGKAVAEEEILALKPGIADFAKLVADTYGKPVDKFEGIFIRRKELAEFLERNTDLMLLSIRQGKRIPDGDAGIRTYDWW